MKRFLWFLVFPGIVLITLLVYRTSLNYYFFQDDWFVLSSVSNLKFLDIWKLFLIRNDVVYYRPLGMQLFFWFGNKLFGLNPHGFHLISFAFHIANIFVIGLISFQIFKNKFASGISSLFYGIAPFHFMTLSWLALTWNNIGTFLVFTSIYFFLRYFCEQKIKYYYFSVTLFIFALFTTEFSIIAPFVSVLFAYIFSKSVNKYLIDESLKLFKFTFPVIIIYFVFRFLFFPHQNTTDYQIVIGPSVFKNLTWYFLWLLAIPQELKFNFVVSQLRFSPIFLNSVGYFLKPFFAIWLILISLIIFVLLHLKNFSKMILVSIIIFVLGLLPVLFLTSHTFPYYLNLASTGIFILIGISLSKFYIQRRNSWSTAIITLFIMIGAFILSYMDFNISLKTSWIPGESAISYESSLLISSLNSKNSKIYIVGNDENKLKQSLMDQDAVKILTNNSNARTFYSASEVIESFKIGKLKKGELIVLNEK